MPIRFSCPSCFKVHSAPDRLAGLPGRCGRCGYRFVTPGVPVPSAPSVFVPVAAPDPYASGGPSPTPRGVAGWGGAMQAVTLGLILAVLLVGFVWHFRDTLVVAHPGLEPLLPPKVAKVRPVPPRVVIDPAQVQAPAHGPVDVPDWSTQVEAWSRQASHWVIYHSILLVFVGLPLLVPPILSRRGYLSMGRWVIFAGVCFLAMSFAGAVYQDEVQRLFGFPSTTKDVASLVCLITLAGTFGCLIAGGISPKTSRP